MTNNDWREISWDPETLALRSLTRSAVGIFQGPSSPLVSPHWVEDFMRNPRRIELSGREGAETLDTWRAQTEEKVAALLEARPWGLPHLLSILRRLPTDWKEPRPAC